jgi:hypothetical protein
MTISTKFGSRSWFGLLFIVVVWGWIFCYSNGAVLDVRMDVLSPNETLSFEPLELFYRTVKSCVMDTESASSSKSKRQPMPNMCQIDSDYAIDLAIILDTTESMCQNQTRFNNLKENIYKMLTAETSLLASNKNKRVALVRMSGNIELLTPFITNMSAIKEALDTIAICTTCHTNCNTLGQLQAILNMMTLGQEKSMDVTHLVKLYRSLVTSDILLVDASTFNQEFNPFDSIINKVGTPGIPLTDSLRFLSKRIEHYFEVLGCDQCNREPSFEAIRILLESPYEIDPQDKTYHTYTLDWRHNARKAILLATDEGSDLPLFYHYLFPGEEQNPRCSFQDLHSIMENTELLVHCPLLTQFEPTWLVEDIAILNMNDSLSFNTTGNLMNHTATQSIIMDEKIKQIWLSQLRNSTSNFSLSASFQSEVDLTVEFLKKYDVSSLIAKESFLTCIHKAGPRIITWA